MADFIQSMTARRGADESVKRTQAARLANMPQGTGALTDTPDTLRSTLSGLLAEGLMKLGMSGRGAYDLGGRTTTVAEAGTPLGMVTGMEDLARAENAGDAQLAAMGLIPGVGPEAKAAGKVGREALTEIAAPGIRAYHGSPHSFEEFDISKVGTGEGAQAYGHGLYFAENEGVARDYRNKLADRPKVLAGGEEVTPTTGLGIFNKTDADATVAGRLSSWAKAQTVTGGKQASAADAIAKVRADLDRGMELAQQNGNFDLWSNLNDQKLSLQRMEERGLDLQHGGHMYEVDIAADPDAFLDWDKSMSDQPEAVRNALFGGPTEVRQLDNGRWAPIDKDGNVVGRPDGWPDQGTASAVAKTMREQRIPNESAASYMQRAHKNPLYAGDLVGTDTASRDELSKALAAKGIPGIKYLDAGSRSADATQGSRNYVVFDDRIISIVKKYGIAGALGAGLISQEMAQQMREQGLEG